MSITFKRINPSRSVAEVEGLGTVEIYGPAYAYNIDINGKRAWSLHRESLEMTELSMKQRIRDWQYLNSFKREEACSDWW